MNRPSARLWRLIVAATISIIVASLGVVVPASPALAAPATTVTITSAVTSAPTHARIPFTIGYAVGGETLQDGEVTVALPGDRWTSSDMRLLGGVSRSFAAVGDDIVVTFELGDVAAGTTGTLNLEARTLHTVLPHGTVVSVDAEISGANATPATTGAPAVVTLEAIAAAGMSVAGQGAVPAGGPAGSPVAGNPGFEVRYRVRPSATCTVLADHGHPNGCLPVVGDITSTMPASAWLARVTALQPTPAELAQWNLPAGTPWDLSAVPAVLGPGATLSIPSRLYSPNTFADANGDIDQDSVFNSHCGFGCPPQIFYVTRPPELEVVIWVPAALAPDTVTLAATHSGADGQGETTSASSSAGVLVTTDNFIVMSKETPGCGPLLVGGDRPNISCNMPYNVWKEYFIDLTTHGSAIDPVVTDVLPAELHFRHPTPPPAGWAVTYSTLAGCTEATPDAAFSASVPPTPGDVRCIRWRHTGVFAGSARLIAAVHRNPAVVLAPGTYILTTNRAHVSGANVPSVDAERQQWLWNVWDAVTTKFGPPIVEPGQEFSYQVVLLDSRAYGSVGPRDYTMVDTLPPEVEYLGHTVVHSLAAPGGGFLPVDCNFTAASRELRCVALGQAADSDVEILFNETFRVDVHVRVADPISADQIANTVCGWADSLEGPLDSLGRPLTWSTNRFAPSCNTRFSDVDAVPVVSNTKSLTAPLGGAPVPPGSTVSYRIDYGHVLPQSRADLVDGYIYDFPGRDPLTGAASGDVVPTVLSAASGGPEQLEYTCAAGSSLATVATDGWSAAPCAGITGVRWRLMSSDLSAPAGTYRRTDPPGHVTLSVAVPGGASHGGTMVNQSVIAAAGMSPAASGPVTIEVTRPADLAIDKTHAAGFGENPGWSGVWTLSVRNNGPNALGAADTVTVTDTLPAGVTYVGATGTGWSCTAAPPVVTCTRPGPVAVGEVLPPISVEVRATAGTHTNAATVSTTAHDPVPDNNTDTDTVSVRALVTARAWGLRTDVVLLGTLALGDTGEVAARTDRHVDRTVQRYDSFGLLNAVLLSGVVDISDGPSGAGPWEGKAVGKVERVSLNVAGVRVVAEGLVARSRSTCTTTDQSITIARLVVNGRVIDVGSPAPNTTIDLGVGQIIINEREGGAVTALRVRVPGLADVRVAYARSAVDCG